MEYVFGLLVLALLILGLRSRRKSNKAWVKEERYEESGDWLDKRSGERGTYGSLDEEMEANRAHIAQQGKISATALAIQSICFAQVAGFQDFDQKKITQHLAFCKSETKALFEQVDVLLRGQTIGVAERDLPPDALRDTVKKRVLDDCFVHFPRILDLEIEQIQWLDRAAAQLSERVLNETKRMVG